MNYQSKSTAYKAQMSLLEFRRISEFIQNNFGIKLPDQKRIMVQGRLHKRLAALEMISFGQYVQYLFSEEGIRKEIPVMVDLISTNKTNFFREAVHFNVLTDVALQDFIKSKSFSTLRVWSAGCSSGEEVYTLAIVINEFFQNHKGYQYRLFGTDISRRMLEKANKAIYDVRDVETIPFHLKKKYLLKHKNKEVQKIRITPELRHKADFGYLNFMDQEYDVNQMFDIVFCRNVLIYFEKKVQEEVIRKLLKNTKPGGYLFLGHSESINDMDLPLEKISPTVFKKKRQ